jgi:hypothetical protein
VTRFTALLNRKSVRIALTGTLVAGGALAISFGGVTSTTIASALRDPMSILGDRSPGARGGGSLADGKLGAVKLANIGADPVGATTPGGPTQRVLSGARPSSQPIITGASGPAPGLVGSVPTSFANPGGGVAGGAIPGGGVVPGTPPGGGGGGIFFPPGTGGGGGGGGVVPNPPTIVPVPEPATWAMMILGFGMIGAMMRRRARPSAANSDSRPADA